VTLIVNGLVNKAPDGAVLDDYHNYHVISEPIIHQLLQELLELGAAIKGRSFR
jgi:hypothetical protein